MRRRQPHLIELTETDRATLQDLMRDGRIPQRIARRARVLLAMAQSETVVNALAEHVAMSRSGIWHLCRRYQQQGLGVVEDALRSGRPRRIPPLGASAN